MCNTPGKCDLCARLAVLLSNLCERRVLDEFAKLLAVGVDFVRVSKRRVLRNVDALLLVPLSELGLLQPRVELDLMRSRNLLSQGISDLM